MSNDIAHQTFITQSSIKHKSYSGASINFGNENQGHGWPNNSNEGRGRNRHYQDGNRRQDS